MSLTSGSKLGPYEIVGSLGAGGMGEVYKARDTRLDRTVAIKVLPPHIADDPEFRDRFEREARTISQLNHPHICTLYDVGTQDGSSFLVMEHLDGETLAARITKSAIPVDQVVAYAIQMADALDAAHRSGILHRDLKPGNVMVTASGIKLLDFGLAKSVGPAAISGARTFGPASHEAMSAPVTMTTPLTAKGTILGTFQYMPPEVVEGEEADARADIWAFGCMLFEMLTGRRPFVGKTQASLAGAILKEEPPSVSTAQPLVPPALDRIVRSCLAKDPNQRVQSAHDLLLNLQWVAEGGSAAGIPAPALARRRSRERSAWIGAALAVGLAGAAAAWFLKPAPPVARVVTRFVHRLPDDQGFTRTGRHTIAVSPDGTFFVYVANQQLYLRRMDQLEAQPIKGTEEDPVEPVISPDGTWVAYFVPASTTSAPGASSGRGAAAGQRGGGQRGGRGGRAGAAQPGQAPAPAPATLKKIPISGGAPIVLASLSFPFGANWQDGTIVIGQGPGGIVSIPEGGGASTEIVKLQDGEGQASSPQLLAGGQRILFTVRKTDAATWNQAQIVVQSLEDGARTLVISGGHDARITPDGALLYVREGTLFGARFDVDRAERTGEPVPLIVGVMEPPNAGGPNAAGPGQFSVSAEGRLVYVPGTAQASGPTDRTLVWVDRQGQEQAIAAETREYMNVRISPDGKKVALQAEQDGAGDIWIWDVEHEILGLLTSEPDAADKRVPIWSPDGRTLLYASTVSGKSSLLRRAADGATPPELLGEIGDQLAAPSFVAPDGSAVVFTNNFRGGDLMTLPLAGDRKAQPLIASAGNDANGTLAPNGRWLAYQSDESGRFEIFVRPYPAVDSARRQVSTGGGVRPVWSRNGRELFYVSPEGRLMAVPVESGQSFSFSRAVPLFETSPYLRFGMYDVAADGRFLFIKTPRVDAVQAIVVVEHWMDEVKARLGK